MFLTCKMITHHLKIMMKEILIRPLIKNMTYLIIRTKNKKIFKPVNYIRHSNRNKFSLNSNLRKHYDSTELRREKLQTIDSKNIFSGKD